MEVSHLERACAFSEMQLAVIALILKAVYPHIKKILNARTVWRLLGILELNIKLKHQFSFKKSVEVPIVCQGS